jgi:hypothetical protein
MAPSGITLPPRPPEELLARCDPAIVAYITALEDVLRKVLGHLDEQETALREAKRQATPFRRSARKKKRKKPGRKGGHARASRPEVDHADEDADAELPQRCSCCGGTAIDEDHTYEQVQEDLEIRKVVRRILVHVGVCQDCGATVEGQWDVFDKEDAIIEEVKVMGISHEKLVELQAVNLLPSYRDGYALTFSMLETPAQ